MIWLLLLVLNGGTFDTHSPITTCTRILDALAGCPPSPGLGVMRSNLCENLTSWLCSMGTAPRMAP